MKSIYYNYYLFNKRCAAFSDFHNRHLYMSIPATRTNIPQSYDAYIVGSDQIWNPQLTNGFHDVYFCDFVFLKERVGSLRMPPVWKSADYLHKKQNT